MVLRSRSARMAGIALAVTTPLVAYAAPAFAVPAGNAGDDAVVSASFPSTGIVRVTSTKGLSKVTVVLCGGTTVVSDSWSGDQKIGDVPVSGIVEAVFVHSGDNTTPEAEALLAALAGAGAVNGNSTGAQAFYNADACKPATHDDGTKDDGTHDDGTHDDGTHNDGTHDDGTNDGGGDNTQTPTEHVVTDPAPETSTPSTPTTSDPAPATSTPSTPATPDPAPTVLGSTVEQIPTVVMGATLEAGAELPRTGSGSAQPLMLLGLSLVAGGLALRTASSRRSRSASSPS